MYESEIAPDFTEGHGDSATPSIYRIFRRLARYRVAIVLGTVAVAVAYVLLAAVLLLRAPSQRVVSLPFRLEFSGASEGQYPNGLKFSSGDIVAAPILAGAYHRNRLDRFIGQAVFAQSLVVIESNQALERLTAEYRSRLADPRLTTVDRERLAAEFEQKSASLAKNEWALALTVPDKAGTIPPTVATKVLQDVLRTWAEDTARTRKGLLYRVPTLTANVFRQSSTEQELVSDLMRLRSRILDVMANIDEVAKVPGAELVRTPGTNLSLAEIQLMLSDLLRVQVEPLIARAIRGGTIRNREATVAALEAQREFDRRQLEAATERAEILRSALADYLTDQYATAAAPRDGTAPSERSLSRMSPAQTADTVMPQLSDSFLDRLVRMSNDSGDREYRQKMVDDIRTAALGTLPLRSTVAFDEQVLQQVQASSAGAADQVTERTLRAQYEAALRQALEAVNGVNSIYALLSRNLEPANQLYTITGPPSSRIERTMSVMRLALGGLITLLVGVAVLTAVALVHDRFRADIEEDQAREAVTEA